MFIVSLHIEFNIKYNSEDEPRKYPVHGPHRLEQAAGDAAAGYPQETRALQLRSERHHRQRLL